MVHHSNITAYYSAIRGLQGGETQIKGGDPQEWRRKYESQVTITKELEAKVQKLEARIKELESQKTATAPAPVPAPKKEEKKAEKNDDDFDLFEDGGDEEWEAEIQKRADEHTAKKKAKMEAEGKAPVIAKSVVTIDVKPWEAETDLVKMEELVRSIVLDGLDWKASKLVPLAYGVRKLNIMAHIEDDKISVDDIQEKIQEFEDYVQSTDIVNFSKL